MTRGALAYAIRGMAALARGGGLESSPAGFSFRRTVGLLRSRSNRGWYAAIVLGNGWVLTAVAEVWLVEKLTGSGLWLGAAAGAPALGSLLAALIGGRWADIPGRRTRMIVAWSFVAASALVLMALIASGAVVGWGAYGAALVCALGFLRGGAFAIGEICARAFQTSVVGEENVDPAARLSALAIASTSVIGPPLAGLLTEVHVTTGLAASVACVGAAVVILGTMRARPEPSPALPERKPAHGSSPPRSRVRAAARQVAENLALPHVRATPALWIAFVALGVSGMVGNWRVLVPLSASQIWGGGADLLGWLAMAVGLGQMVGSLYCLTRNASFGMIVGGSLTMVPSGIAVALAPSAAFEFLALVLYGTGYGVIASAIVTIVQAKADRGQRGRVIALYTTVGLGSMVPGSLAVGGIAAAAGPRAGWVVQSAVAFAIALTVIALRAVHRAALASPGGLPRHPDSTVHVRALSDESADALRFNRLVASAHQERLLWPGWMKRIVGDARGREALALLEAACSFYGTSKPISRALLTGLTEDALTRNPDEAILRAFVGSTATGRSGRSEYWGSLVAKGRVWLYATGTAIAELQLTRPTGWVAVCSVDDESVTPLAWVRVTLDDLPPGLMVVARGWTWTPPESEFTRDATRDLPVAMETYGVALWCEVLRPTLAPV